jgi:hypothetical protein
MTKRLSAVVGEYQDKQTNQQKAEWQNIGVIGVGKNGKEYVLLDPSVSLAGVLVKQNVLAAKRGENPSDMVMTSVFEENNQQQAPQQQQQGFQQNNQQQQHQQQQYQQQSQGGFQQQR